MKRHLWYYVVAAVAVVVGVLAFGVPHSGLWLIGFVVICPISMGLMMWLMMRGGIDRSGSDHSASSHTGSDQDRADLTGGRHSWPRS